MKPPAALPALVLCSTLAACARPAPQTAEMPPPPATYSLTATTVRRTDTAAPSEGSAPATSVSPSDAGASSAATGDAAVAAVSPDASGQPASEPVPAAGPQSAALAALDAQHARLASCYDALLGTATDATGRLNVELAVTSANEITRVDVRAEGDTPLAQARSCVEAALRGARFSQTPAVGAVVRRSYSFVNPPVELTAPSPLRVQAPARNGRTAEATAAATATPATPATPATGSPAEAVRGVLTTTEVSAQLAQTNAALQTCYGTALRRASRASGGGDLRFSIQADGQVSSATWGAASEPIALMGECIGAAVRAQRFRASGTGANVRVSVEFAR